MQQSHGKTVLWQELRPDQDKFFQGGEIVAVQRALVFVLVVDVGQERVAGQVLVQMVRVLLHFQFSSLIGFKL